MSIEAGTSSSIYQVTLCPGTLFCLVFSCLLLSFSFSSFVRPPFTSESSVPLWYKCVFCDWYIIIFIIFLLSQVIIFHSCCLQIHLGLCFTFFMAFICYMHYIALLFTPVGVKFMWKEKRGHLGTTAHIWGTLCWFAQDFYPSGQYPDVVQITLSSKSVSSIPKPNSWCLEEGLARVSCRGAQNPPQCWREAGKLSELDLQPVGAACSILDASDRELRSCRVMSTH